MRMISARILLLPCLAACAATPSRKDSSDSGPPPTPPSVASWELGWRRGDLHVHSTYSDGIDDVATLLELAGWLRDERFLAAHPEYRDHGLDFLAITDHSSFESASDPAFTSPVLEPIPGAEWNFGASEANLLGVQEGVSSDPDGDGTSASDLALAARDLHARGGLLSINHPCIETYPFGWDLREHDAVEIWNTGWSLGVAPSSPETLRAWEARFGDSSPFYAYAVESRALHSAGEALAFYQALLRRGVLSAAVGGSDHHLLFLPGFPTTWVRVDDGERVLDGLGRRHSFVSRQPSGPELLLRASCDDEKGEIEAGDHCPVAGRQSLFVSTARAPGGRLRILHGSAVPSDEALAGLPLAEVAWESPLDAEGAVEEWSVELDLAEGDWVMAQILEALVPEAEEAEHGELLRELARASASATNDASGLAALLDSIVSGDPIGDPESCDPELWDPLELQCVLADERPPGTLFVPDLLNRAFNAETIDGEPTGSTVGALSSAMLFGG